jgi:radical SAM protein with 4Fe4S-binding SPASM domain
MKFPKVVRIETSGLCNLKCVHCPTGTVKMNRGIMKNVLFNKIFKEINDNVDSVKVVVLYHGGEPLIDVHLTKRIKMLKKIGVEKVKIVSNGMFIDTVASEIIKSGLDEIEVSLDGRSQDECEIIRRGCNYKRIVNNIKILDCLKKSMESQTPVINIVSTQFDTGEFPTHLRDEFVNCDVNFSVFRAILWQDMVVDYDMFDVIYEENKDNVEVCDHLESTFTIRWNGDVVPCCYDLTSLCVLGNVNVSTIGEILNSDEYSYMRDSIKTKRYNKLCSKCYLVAKYRGFLVQK